MPLRALLVLLTSTLLGVVATPLAAQEAPPNPRVLVETSEGDFEIELFKSEVPATVVNFLMYVQAGYYDGTIFHRVIRNVIAQGGGFVDDGTDAILPKVEGLRGQILNEAGNGRRNREGTIAMARGAEPNSARQQFFINLDNNAMFDQKNRTAEGFGYAVFGEVTDGLDVVRRIGRTRTSSREGFENWPREPIVIHSITQIEAH